jgi:hypothetical protein
MYVNAASLSKDERTDVPFHIPYASGAALVRQARGRSSREPFAVSGVV